MKLIPKFPMPWDMAVFLAITSVGFGFSVQKLVQNDVKDDSRSPSSASSLISSSPPSIRDGIAAVHQTVDLGCLENQVRRQRVQSEEGSIRFKGKLCRVPRGKRARPVGELRVKNVTNGYEGTVFFQGMDSSFLTDFLVLQSGKNVIQVEWRETASSTPEMLVAEVFER